MYLIRRRFSKELLFYFIYRSPELGLFNGEGAGEATYIQYSKLEESGISSGESAYVALEPQKCLYFYVFIAQKHFLFPYSLKSAIY
jgi:hypothetical protein